MSGRHRANAWVFLGKLQLLVVGQHNPEEVDLKKHGHHERSDGSGRPEHGGGCENCDLEDDKDRPEHQVDELTYQERQDVKTIIPVYSP